MQEGQKALLNESLTSTEDRSGLDPYKLEISALTK